MTPKALDRGLTVLTKNGTRDGFLAQWNWLVRKGSDSEWLQAASNGAGGAVNGRKERRKLLNYGGGGKARLQPA